MRKVKATSKVIVETLLKRDILMKEMDDLLKQGEKIQNEMNKIGIKIQKEKEKAAVATMKMDLELSEFEIPVRANIIDQEKYQIEFEITDQVEDYKEAVRKKRLGQEKEGN